LVFGLQRHKADAGWGIHPVQLNLQHLRENIGALRLFRRAEADGQTAVPGARYGQYGARAPDPTPAQSSPPAQRFNIQTARSDVGRHQHAGAAVGETDQRLIAIALFQIAMQRQCALPGGIQRITNRLTVFLVLQNTTQDAG
jgi:hypothetical protein